MKITVEDPVGEEVIEEVAGEEVAVEEAEQPEDEDEVVVSIGDQAVADDVDDETKKPLPAWVKDLRERDRANAKRVKELERELGLREPKQSPLGEKPTLASCDYDNDRFEAEIEKWHDRKREHDSAEQARKAEQEAADKAWQSRVESYGEKKKALRVRDYEDAEATVLDTLSATQQGIILQGAENPELVVYALGKNRAKLSEVAAIKDHVTYAFAIAKLEAQLKVTNRKTAPAPEKTVSSSGVSAAPVDSQLDRLREEAARTGDGSKLMAYKRQLKAKAKA